MASACVNNVSSRPDSAFLDFAAPCLRVALSRNLEVNLEPAASELNRSIDPDDSGEELPEFEFRIDDPVVMLPADELFSEGKLVPLRTVAVQLSVESADEKNSSELEMVTEVLRSDPYQKSFKATRSASRWRELLGLKRNHNAKEETHKSTSPSQKGEENHKSTSPLQKGLNPSNRSFRRLLRHAKPSSSVDSFATVPLLRDSLSEPASISARRSLSSSSSSSGADHDELPRFSLDSERPTQSPILLSRAPPAVRLSQPRRATTERQHQPERGEQSPVRRRSEAGPAPLVASVDSPRMNASGKVVFQGLERSSSSPGSCQGGSHRQRVRPYQGMERSYSSNVRVTPVLNVVPVGSLLIGSSKPGSVFGLGQLLSPSKNSVGVRRNKIVERDRNPEQKQALQVKCDEYASDTHPSSWIKQTLV
ncbi:uncharacterized protein LOC122046560 isoform X1 [Zingiber officinale]|uniref:Uncharacterized protein n=1 Tax=Zingiber officinale TaxID=94328 RepID=A0A8J5HI29_ZINOF|nr:uncharacterized protein LOC122046560 isoform X1 [Zingiber officinale]KAG6525071.1 hypothetical protein ZIOFF_015023 [Zingiber officinale]